MRGVNLFLMCTLSLLITSCTQNSEWDITRYRVQVLASVGSDSRTTVNDDAQARQAVVTWDSGDRIGVVATTSEAISTLDLLSGAGGRTATFDGEIATSDATMESYWAFYPNQSEAAIVDGRLVLELPIEQQNVSTGIDGANCGFMVAKCTGAVEGLSFDFENLFAVVRLSLTGAGEQIARIAFSGGAGEYVAGAFEVDMTTEVPSIEFGAGGSTRVYLMCDRRLTTDPSVMYVVVPAIEYVSGYSVRITTTNGQTMQRTVGRSSGRTLEAGTIYNLPTLDFASEGYDLSLAGRANSYIVSQAGSYCFDSGLSGGASAEILWEDCEGLIAQVGLSSDGYVTFEATSERGNALLVVRDAAGEIIGSWHIWATEEPKAQIYSDGTVALDRNLGALSPTDAGLFYQWGRRAPFTDAPIEKGEGTLAESTSRPDLFFTNWGALGPSADLWGNPTSATYSKVQGAKSAEDPCPAGWRIAPPSFYRSVVGSMKAGDGYFTVALEDDTAYYPFTDRLTPSGILSGSSQIGFLWSNSNYISSLTSTLYGTYMQFATNTSNISSFVGSGKKIYANKSYGQNVRCVAE